MQVLRYTNKFRIDEQGNQTDLISSETVVVKKNATPEYFKSLRERAKGIGNYARGSSNSYFFSGHYVIGQQMYVRQTFELIKTDKEVQAIMRAKAKYRDSKR